MKRAVFLFLIGGVLLPTVMYGQEYFTRQQLQADIDDLYLHLREVHPDPFFNISQGEFESRLDSVKTSLPDSLTALGLYSYIAPLIVSLGDGHTSIAVPLNHFYWENPFVPPLDYRIDQKDLNLYVKGSLVDIPEGARIVEVNGMPAKEIVDRFLSYANGETLGHKIYYANHFLPVFYSFLDSSPTYDITYIADGAQYKCSDAEAFQYNMTDYTEPPGKKWKPEESYTFSKVDRDAVLLKVNRFFDHGNVLDSMIDYIHEEGITNLIIDLRGTPGGNDAIPISVIMHFSTSRFKLWHKKIYKEITPRKREKYHTVRLKGASLIKNPHSRFDGNVYVLTDNGTYSAAVMFANCVKNYKYGTIVGEPTGGHISMFGGSSELRLPNTKLNYRVAKVAYLEHCNQRIRQPVYPDIEVPSEEALDRVLEIIRQDR